MTRTLAALAATLTLCVAGSADAACRFDAARIYFGSESTMRGEVDSGKICGFALSGGGSTGSGEFRVSQPPRHGAAAIGETYAMPAVGYRSAAGYRGADEFVVTFVGGRVGQSEQPGSIHVYVDVK
jgi:hypothetical protein